MKHAMASLDVGTSSIRASAFDLHGKILSMGKGAYPTCYPRPGWATQNPQHWESAAIEALGQMQKNLPPEYRVAVITLTGQCPTYVPLNAELNPVGDALIYQDNRAVQEAAWIEEIIGAGKIHNITGHSAWAFYVLPKILWQRTHQPDLYRNIRKIGQPTDYLAYILTGELVTDQTHANATLLYDIHKEDWSDDILEKMHLDREMLPEKVLKPWQQAGCLLNSMADKTGLESGLPVVIGAADSQCSCMGTGTLNPGIISEMSGSSSCLNNTVFQILDHPAIGHYNHVIPDCLCTEVGLNTTGAAIHWFLHNILKQNDNTYLHAENEAAKVAPGCSGLFFIPYLCDGERDSPDVKGGFLGLTMNHGQAEMVRSIYEGVAFSIRKRVEILQNAGCNFQEMRVSGGGAGSSFWNQIKANVLGMPVRAITEVDGAELGAAMLGAIGQGLFESWESAVDACVLEGNVFWPEPTEIDAYQETFQQFLTLENLQIQKADKERV